MNGLTELTPETEKFLLDSVEESYQTDFITQILSQSQPILMDAYVSPVSSQNGVQDPSTSQIASNDPSIKMQRINGPYNVLVDVLDEQCRAQNSTTWKGHVMLRNRVPFKLFAVIDRCFTLSVKVESQPPRGSRLRIFPQFMSTEASVTEAVYCCPVHICDAGKQAPSSSTGGSSSHELSQNTLRQRSVVEAVSSKVKYQLNPQGLPKALCLLFDIDALTVPAASHLGERIMYIPLKFRCFNSCAHGMSRQRVQLWITLECPSADSNSLDGYTVSGVDHLEFKSCASPSRDSAQESCGITPKATKILNRGKRRSIAPYTAFHNVAICPTTSSGINSVLKSLARSSSGSSRLLPGSSSRCNESSKMKLCVPKSVVASSQENVAPVYTCPNLLSATALMGCVQGPQQPLVTADNEGCEIDGQKVYVCLATSLLEQRMLHDFRAYLHSCRNGTDADEQKEHLQIYEQIMTRVWNAHQAALPKKH